jgi:hypothetical protein
MARVRLDAFNIFFWIISRDRVGKASISSGPRVEVLTIFSAIVLRAFNSASDAAKKGVKPLEQLEGSEVKG